MGVREIPKLYQFTCDVCRMDNTQPLNVLPKTWSKLTVAGGKARGYDGSDIEKLLCESCAERTIRAIEGVEPK